MWLSLFLGSVLLLAPAPQEPSGAAVPSANKSNNPLSGPSRPGSDEVGQKQSNPPHRKSNHQKSRGSDVNVCPGSYVSQLCPPLWTQSRQFTSPPHPLGEGLLPIFSVFCLDPNNHAVELPPAAYSFVIQHLLRPTLITATLRLTGNGNLNQLCLANANTYTLSVIAQFSPFLYGESNAFALQALGTHRFQFSVGTNVGGFGTADHSVVGTVTFKVQNSRGQPLNQFEVFFPALSDDPDAFSCTTDDQDGSFEVGCVNTAYSSTVGWPGLPTGLPVYLENDTGSAETVCTLLQNTRFANTTFLIKFDDHNDSATCQQR